MTRDKVPSRRRACPALPAVILIALASPSCREVPHRDSFPEVPAAVLVRPVPPDRGKVSSPLEPESLIRKVASGFRDRGTFAKVAVQEGPVPAGEGQPDIDYVCEIEMVGTGSNAEEPSEFTSMAALSTAIWLCTWFPSWWVPDRLYPNSDCVVLARFLPAGREKGARPFFTVEFPMAPRKLSLLRRGTPLQIFLTIIVPPFLLASPEEAKEALWDIAFTEAERELPGKVAREWPAAALAGPPGSFLVIDPGGGGEASEEAADELSLLLAARDQISEIAVTDVNGNPLARLDRAALQKRLVPTDGKRAEDARAWNVVEERLGPSSPRPSSLYKIALGDLGERRSEMVRISAAQSRGSPPANFTVPLKRRR